MASCLYMKTAMIGTTLAQRFRIESLIETTPGCVSYVARQVTLDRLVLLTIFALPADDNQKLTADESAPAPLQAYFQALSSLNHPNILALFSASVTADGKPYTVTELFDGQSLEKLLLNGPLPVETVLEIFAQTANALGEAHAKGLLHGNLQPANILIGKSADGGTIVKVSGFGELKVERLLGTFGKAASPEFFSPEQAQAQPLDVRSDIYSFGCLMYAALTARSPLNAVLPLRKLDIKVPSRLELVVARFLNLNRSQRFQTMNEIASNLTRILAVDSPGLPIGPLLIAFIVALATFMGLKFFWAVPPSSSDSESELPRIARSDMQAANELKLAIELDKQFERMDGVRKASGLEVGLQAFSHYENYLRAERPSNQDLPVAFERIRHLSLELANDARERNKFDMALLYAEKAKRLGKEANDNLVVSVALKEEADVMMAENKWQKSLELALQASRYDGGPYRLLLPITISQELIKKYEHLSMPKEADRERHRLHELERKARIYHQQ